MKAIIASISAAIGLASSSAALAEWYTVTVTNVYMVVDGSYATSDLPAPRVMVFGNFTPAFPCPVKAFVLVPSDPLYKETYAMFVAARLSGTPIQYFHVYCTSPSGLGRGNLYQLGS
jgi:hypothetical protein